MGSPPAPTQRDRPWSKPAEGSHHGDADGVAQRRRSADFPWRDPNTEAQNEPETNRIQNYSIGSSLSGAGMSEFGNRWSWSIGAIYGFGGAAGSMRGVGSFSGSSGRPRCCSKIAGTGTAPPVGMGGSHSPGAGFGCS